MTNITAFSGFNISNWGGPGQYHNGIDLTTSGYNWTIMNCCAPGKVTRVFQHQNLPYSNDTMFSISIEVAENWTVTYVLEPGAITTSTISLQNQNIYVTEGQCVEIGQIIARLLDLPDKEVHLHFMVYHNDENICPYSVSSDASKAVFDALATKFGKTICCTNPSDSGCIN